MRTILLFLAGFVACHPRPGASSCNEMVEVLDFAQLDGCEYLLLTKDSLKLLASNAQDYNLKDFARAQISYRELAEMSSICMTEDKIVEITCFSADKSIPRKPPCLKYTGIAEGGWLQTVAEEWQPQQVRRYKYLDGFVYFCKIGSETKIYDCQGTLLCTITPATRCPEYTKSLTDEVVIWTSHR